MGDNVRNFAWPITATTKENYTVVTRCVEEHQKLFANRKIIIFGAGIRGAEISVILENEGYSNISFTDNNSEKWGGVIDNYPIISVEEALGLRNEVVYLVSTEEGEPICRQLEEYGLRRDIDFFFPKSDLYQRFIREFRRDMHEEVLVMGDCMFEVVAFDDNRKESLTELIQQKLGYENVKHLTMHGMGFPLALGCS